MKFLCIFSTALVLLLGAVIAHAQGIKNESSSAGFGNQELQYYMLVPEGITITNKEGDVFKAGQVVVVPNSNVTILESAYAKEQMKNNAFKSSFVNEKTYAGMPEDKVHEHMIVSVKVPKGVTVAGFGKTIKGPSSVTLIAAKAAMQATQAAMQATQAQFTGLAAGGCASTSDLATVKKDADEAKAMARHALDIANEATSMSMATEEKINRMFKKEMYR